METESIEFMDSMSIELIDSDQLNSLEELVSNLKIIGQNLVHMPEYEEIQSLVHDLKDESGYDVIPNLDLYLQMNKIMNNSSSCHLVCSGFISILEGKITNHYSDR